MTLKKGMLIRLRRQSYITASNREVVFQSLRFPLENFGGSCKSWDDKSIPRYNYLPCTWRHFDYNACSNVKAQHLNMVKGCTIKKTMNYMKKHHDSSKNREVELSGASCAGTHNTTQPERLLPNSLCLSIFCINFLGREWRSTIRNQSHSPQRFYWII